MGGSIFLGLHFILEFVGGVLVVVFLAANGSVERVVGWACDPIVNVC